MLRTSAPLIGALAVKISLMEELTDPLILAVELVLNVWSLLAIFEGTRRVRLSGGRWWKSKLLLIGMLWALFAAGQNLAYLLIAKETRLLEARGAPTIGESWGSNLSAEKRTKYSQALASVAIRSGKHEANAFDLNGHLVPYCPTAEDIEARTRAIRSLTILELKLSDCKTNAIQWVSSIFVAIGLALMASHPQHAKRIGFDS